MRTLLYSLFLFAIHLILIGCTTSETPTSVFSSIDSLTIDSIYQQYGVTGSLVLYDQNQATYQTYHAERTQQGYIPASTFKIINALIALEDSIVADEDEMFPWDSVERSVEVWNQDHNLRSGLKYSVVWLYQRIARQVGEDRYRKWLTEADYGNHNPGGGVDMFWLNGDLRISPMQQIDFLRRLYHNELPFSQRSLDIVKDIMIYEQTDQYTIRAKTGWSDAFTPGVGWFVGYLETNGNVYFFANQLDIRHNEDIQARAQIVKDVFEKSGLLSLSAM